MTSVSATGLNKADLLSRTQEAAATRKQKEAELANGPCSFLTSDKFQKTLAHSIGSNLGEIEVATLAKEQGLRKTALTTLWIGVGLFVAGTVLTGIACSPALTTTATAFDVGATLGLTGIVGGFAALGVGGAIRNQTAEVEQFAAQLGQWEKSLEAASTPAPPSAEPEK